MSAWPSATLEAVASVVYGTRVTRKRDGGTGFPVYGGGGETFRVDQWNRQDCFIISRFAMSAECVRYVSGQFFLNDSGLTVETSDPRVLNQEFLDRYLLAKSAEIYELSRGTAQRNLDVPAFRGLEIPLPPLDEQKRIVAKLDGIANELSQIQAVLDQRAERFQALVNSTRRAAIRRANRKAEIGPLSLGMLEELGYVQIGRGKVISKKDMDANRGEFPVYSSSGTNGGEFGRYGDYMFDEEMITWSVDGGGYLFFRPKHKFSVTNVGGWIRVLRPDLIECKFLCEVLIDLHSRIQFDWVFKAHSGVIKKVYSEIYLPTIAQQEVTIAAIGQISGLMAEGLHTYESQRRRISEFQASTLQATLVSQ